MCSILHSVLDCTKIFRNDTYFGYDCAHKACLQSHGLKLFCMRCIVRHVPTLKTDLYTLCIHAIRMNSISIQWPSPFPACI